MFMHASEFWVIQCIPFAALLIAMLVGSRRLQTPRAAISRGQTYVRTRPQSARAC